MLRLILKTLFQAETLFSLVVRDFLTRTLTSADSHVSVLSGQRLPRNRLYSCEWVFRREISRTATSFSEVLWLRGLLAGFQIALSFAMLSHLCSLSAKATRREEPARVTVTEEGRKWAEKLLQGFSLEEKVGQLLQVRYYADYPDFDSGEYKYLREELQKYHIGSVVFGMHFNKSGPMRSSASDAAKVANQMQHDSKLPLLLAADIERGVASRLHDVPSFTWPMAFGAIGDANEVEHFAAITAQEARAIGIHWALAPVADINNNPANPVINTRSFGEDPDQVGAL